MITYFFKAIRLLYALNYKAIPSLKVQEKTWPCLTDVPVLNITSSHQEKLLILHGLNGLGHHDIRLHRLAAAMTVIGFDVYLPHFSAAANQIITQDSTQSLMHIFEQAYHYFNGPFSVIAPSIVGTHCLEILSYEKARLWIKSFCCIGSPHSITHLIEHALSSTPIEPYVLIVILKYYLYHQGLLTDLLSKALTHLSNRFQADELKQPAISFSLNAEEQFWYDNALNETFVRQQVGKQYYEWHLIDVSQYIPRIKTPIAIIHGNHDPIIPVTCAHWLQNNLTESPRSLAITSLLTHGDIKPIFSWSDIKQLLSTLTFFLKYAQKPKTKDLI